MSGLRSQIIGLLICGPLIATGGDAQTLDTTTWTASRPTMVTGPIVFDPRIPVIRYGDRVVSIAAHPTDPSVVYVATAGGGVWKTIDAGQTWVPLTDDQTTLVMGAIAVARSDPLVIYAGTGEANGSDDSFYGRGVLVSRDGGATWTLQHNQFAFDRRAIAGIVVDPDDPEIAYVAVAANAVNGLSGNTGIWKTTDGGTTWTNTTSSITSSGFWSSVAIDPLTPSTLYAAVGNVTGSVANGVYKTSNGGTTWTRLPEASSGLNAGRITIAVAPSMPHVLYVAVHGTGGTGSTPLGSLYRFMRSDDGGVTFVNHTSSTPDYMGAGGWYASSLSVDPSNAAVVIAAGAGDGPFRTEDGGLTWSEVPITIPPPSLPPGSPGGRVLRPDHYAAAFDASGRYLDGSAIGLHRRAADGGWLPLLTDVRIHRLRGIAVSSTPNGAIGPFTVPRTVLAWSEAADLIWSTRSTQSSSAFGWTQVRESGSPVEFSRTNGLRAYHTGPPPVFVRRSDCGGLAFPEVPSIDPCSGWRTKANGITDDTSAPVPPLAVDPLNGDRVLFGAQHLWETVDAGENWYALGGPFPATISLIGLSVTDPDVIYVYAGTTIYLTRNHGVSWTSQRQVTGPLREVQVDPGAPLTAYAVLSAFDDGQGRVFRTIDGFQSWESITGDLPDVPVWSIEVDPEMPQLLFVGTDIGVYRSVNGGGSWSRFGVGLPDVAVRQVRLYPEWDLLAAATYGRGLWEILATGRGPQLTEHPTTVPPGATVVAAWIRNLEATDRDWIGLYQVDASPIHYLEWIYIGCTQTVRTRSATIAGSCEMVVPSTLPPGTYELRLLANDSADVRATSPPFEVASPVQLSTSTSAATPGQSIVVTWTGVGSPTPTDWLGLYQVGAPPTSFLEWAYVSCSKTPDVGRPSGSCPFILPTGLPPGQYTIRLLANDGWTLLATTAPITVTPTTSGPSLSAMPALLAPGAVVFATWDGVVAASPTDWIGLYRAGTSAIEFIEWVYVSCSKTPAAARPAGTCAVELPQTLASGDYSLRLLANDGFEVLATSNPVIVGGN